MDHTVELADLEFELPGVIHTLSALLDSFPNDELGQAVGETTQTIKSRKLQAAVVGEFKRGKSTLINALLGMPILPMDVLPATASINRITYGPTPRVLIHFRDGRDTEVGIDQLENYVTQLTRQSAVIAETIREAEVQYPTELCSNHIEILDTPGLNDSPEMDALTNQLLGDIHVIIMTVDADSPYSETECQWVAKALSLPNLQKILFVFTKVDLVRPRERDRILQYTAERIRKKTLEAVEEMYPNQPELIDLARRMFPEQDFPLYGVSAQLALDSFETGDPDLLAQSQIPNLKRELVTVINAQKSYVGLYRCRQLVDQFAQTLFAEPVQDTLRQHYRDRALHQDLTARVGAYFAQRQEEITKRQEQMVRDARQKMEDLFRTCLPEEQILNLFQRGVEGIPVTSGYSGITLYLEYLAKQVNERIFEPLSARVLRLLRGETLLAVRNYLYWRDEQLNAPKTAQLLARAGFPTGQALLETVTAQLREKHIPDRQGISLHLPKTFLNRKMLDVMLRTEVRSAVSAYRSHWLHGIGGASVFWTHTVPDNEPEALREQLTSYLSFAEDQAVRDAVSRFGQAKGRVDDLVRRAL